MTLKQRLHSSQEPNPREESRVRKCAPEFKPLNDRARRTERAVRFARLVLDLLPEQDQARPLLNLAITRRDCTLLEALLAELRTRRVGATSGRDASS